MKNKIGGWVIGLLVIIIVAGIFYIGYKEGQRKEIKKALDALEEKTRNEIAIKDAAILDRDRQIKELEKTLAGINERLDGLAEERSLWKEEAEKWKEKAKESPPEHLVTDIRSILGTNEIWLVDDGVLFSIDAFRIATEKFYDWQDFTLNREPNYKETIEAYKTNVLVLTESNGLLKEQIEDLTDIRALQMTFNEEMKEFIVKNSDSGFWSTVKNIGTGIAIGTLGVLIFTGK
jgi:hypothetical protein